MNFVIFQSGFATFFLFFFIFSLLYSSSIQFIEFTVLHLPFLFFLMCCLICCLFYHSFSAALFIFLLLFYFLFKLGFFDQLPSFFGFSLFFTPQPFFFFFFKSAPAFFPVGCIAVGSFSPRVEPINIFKSFPLFLLWVFLNLNCFSFFLPIPLVVIPVVLLYCCRVFSLVSPIDVFEFFFLLFCKFRLLFLFLQSYLLLLSSCCVAVGLFFFSY